MLRVLPLWVVSSASSSRLGIKALLMGVLFTGGVMLGRDVH